MKKFKIEPGMSKLSIDALKKSGISVSFGSRGSCTMTMKCAGDTISCTSPVGDCEHGKYCDNIGEYISIICDGREYGCRPNPECPGGSGSGGSGPTEPGGGEDPDKPGGSGSGGSGSEPSVPGEGENPNKPGGSGSGGSGTEPSVPDNHNGKGNCCKNKRLL